MKTSYFRIIVIIAIIIIPIFALNAITRIVAVDSKNSIQSITAVLGFAGTIIVSLFTLLKQDTNNQEGKQRSETTQTQIKELSSKVDDAAVKVEETKKAIAEGMQVAIDSQGNTIVIPAMPANLPDLEKILKEAVSSSCEQINSVNKELKKTLEDSNKELHQIKHDMRGARNASELQKELIEQQEKHIADLEKQLAEHRKVVEHPVKVEEDLT